MIKVTIKNLQGVETNGAIFLNTNDVNKWIKEQKKLLAFGLVEGWYVGHLLTPEQRSLATKTKNKDELGNRLPEKLYYILDQFVVETKDITDEDNDNKRFEKSSAKIDFGQYLIKYVHFLNDKKNISPEQLMGLFSDTQFQQIKLLLETGSLKSAKSLIGTFTNPFYTDQDKDVLVKKIKKFLKDYGEDV